MRARERKLKPLLNSFLTLKVVFNRKYLLGFHKRKVERKKKAREELEDRIKQERKRQKELVRSLINSLVFD